MQQNIEQGMGKIVILLSTYYAETYIREQLDSLFAQTYPNIEIVVRDDGSKDSTLQILEEYKKQHVNFQYYAGDNVGAKNSFFDLMKHVQEWDFDYCAFCDQDDYWKPEKLYRAVDKMKKESQTTALPVLYCGKTQLVDAQLKPLEKEIKRQIRPAFANALVENIVTGCTTVLNRSMYDIMMHYVPKYCIMHDWWMYLVGTCFGRVLFDETPYILYRQHGNNVMGIESSYATEMKHRMQKFKGRKSNICMQAEELVRLMKKYHNEWKADESICQSYRKAKCLATYKESLKKRFRLAFGRQVFRQRKGDNLIFKILFLLGMR